ncbi:MAG: double zinc ribbon domain-containing protein [Nibricoccus sp.]
MKTLLKRLARDLGDVTFPPICVSCDGLVEAGEFQHVCTKCAEKFDFVSEPACYVCGHPFYGELAGERMCPHCEGLSPSFRQGRTCVLFKGPARALVHELKYHRGLYALGDIKAVIKRCARVLELVRGAILVPVPLHSRKERERGYNQSLLLAEAFAEVAGHDTRVEMLIQRKIDTVSQTAFDRKTRRANLKNAFSVKPCTIINSAHHYILVDDVFTTGSTLNSCAGVLRRAGCMNLDVVTFGHG